MDSTFYFLSKLAWAVFSPSNFLIILTSVGTAFLFCNRIFLAKLFLIPSVLGLVIIMTYPIGDWLIEPLEDRFKRPDPLPERIDGILILGGAEDLLRSFKHKTAELKQSGERFFEAARLSRIYPDTPVIFSGSSGEIHLKNDTLVSEYILVNLGINPARLIIESLSKNTYENFVFTKPILPKADGTYLLITSAFHMPRSVALAKENNISVIPYPVDYRSLHPWHRDQRISFYNNINSLEAAAKEWMGLTAYYWTAKTSDWFPKSPH